jgi:Uma2 family endonuclease
MLIPPCNQPHTATRVYSESRSSTGAEPRVINRRALPSLVPTTFHSRIQWKLVTLLRQQGIDALPEVRIRLRDRKSLIPDVVAAPELQGPYPTEPVLLCVEILSPGEHLRATLAKCEQYHAWGVPFCWVVDPEKQTGWQYHSGGEPEHVERGGTITAGELSVHLEELFSDQPR